MASLRCLGSTVSARLNLEVKCADCDFSRQRGADGGSRHTQRVACLQCPSSTVSVEVPSSVLWQCSGSTASVTLIALCRRNARLMDAGALDGAPSMFCSQ